MPTHALLNNVEHKGLRVITTRSAELGDDVMFAFTFPFEFRKIQAYYPIVFRKADDGTVAPIALFGFQEKQNLFLRRGGWDAPYVPLMIERMPFMIGRSGEELLVHMDLESPRISRKAGEALFLEHGGSSEFLNRVNANLLAIHQGLEGTPAFVAALLEHQLLTSFTLDVKLDDGPQPQLTGFYAIHEERLNALEGTALEALNKAGHLQPIYMAIASLANFGALIGRHKLMNAGAGGAAI